MTKSGEDGSIRRKVKSVYCDNDEVWGALPISRTSVLVGNATWDAERKRSGCYRGERTGSRAIDWITQAACPNFVHLYITVVNKSLSTEVPYTGHLWQHNATKNNKHGNADELGDELNFITEG